MAATITLTNGERLLVTSGEAEKVTDVLMRDETGVIKIRDTAGRLWMVRPQDIESAGS